MIVPASDVRETILGFIYAAWRDGAILKAGDVRRAIAQSHPEGNRSSLRVPLFWAMVNSTYGPLRIDQCHNAGPIPEREVPSFDEAVSIEDWMHRAHSAWLAQAIYRVHDRFPETSPSALASAFFESPTAQDLKLIEIAVEAAREDANGRALLAGASEKVLTIASTGAANPAESEINA